MRVLSIFGGGHDSSATFVVDGKVERYLKEERYTGVKHDTNHNAIIRTIIDEDLLKDVDYILNVNQLEDKKAKQLNNICLLYTSPSPRDQRGSRMPSSA